MATVDVTYSPAAGRKFVTLTSWAGDAAFSPAPVADGQIEGPDALTMGADGVVTGSDGTYELNYISPTGEIQGVSYEITTADTTAPIISTLTAAGTDPDTIDVAFSTDEDNGTAYFFASGSTSETAAAIKAGAQGSQDVSATGDQSLTLTLATGTYRIHALHEDDAGNQSNVLSSAEIVLAAIPEVGTGTATYSPPANMTLTIVQAPADTYMITGADDKPEEDWPSPPETGEQALTFTADGILAPDLTWQGYAEGAYPFYYISNDGTFYQRTVTTGSLDSLPDEVPQGTWTIGTITTGETTATLTPSYSLTDAASFQYSINSGDWVTFTGTISLTALADETAFSGALRATNSIGSGASASFSFTTDRIPVPPTVSTALPDLNLSEGEAVSINLGNYFAGAVSYGVTGFPAGSGLAFSDNVISGTANTSDSAASPFTLTVTATNADGSESDAFAVAVVQPGPVLIYSGQSTADTTPLLYGAVDDPNADIDITVSGAGFTAINLTGVVSGGNWSAQITQTLSPRNYTVTVTATSQAGISSEVIGTLAVFIIGIISGRRGALAMGLS